MGYFIITDSNWTRLRNEILSLAETCHKAFGEQSKHTDWLHNGDVCKLLNISKRTLQHYRDTGVLPFSQIGHKCYYRREDVELLLQSKSEKSKKTDSKITNRDLCKTLPHPLSLLFLSTIGSPAVNIFGF